MLSVGRLSKKKLTFAFKPGLLKVAVKSPLSGLPILFYIDRLANLSDFNNILKAEFKIDKDFEFLSFDSLGKQIVNKREDWNSVPLRNILEESLLEVKQEDFPDKILAVKYEAFGSAIHKEKLLDSTFEVLKNGIFEENKTEANIQRFDEYLQKRFPGDFIRQNSILLTNIQNTAKTHEKILENMQNILSDLKKKSERSSLRPIFGLITLSCMNFSFLFVFTFFVYDWNVVEPISYLISLGAQIALIYGYFRTRKAIDYEYFYHSCMKNFKEFVKKNEFYTGNLRERARAYGSMQKIISGEKNL